MEIALEKSTETNASLKIKLTKSDYQPEVDKKLKDYGRRASIKGFRPGKVPPSLIQKMYGKSVLVDEINELLKNTVNNYIRDNKLQVVGDPMPDREQADAIDWDTQSEFEFNYNLGLASDFDVDFNALPPVPAYEIEAGDAELDNTIEELKTRFSGHAHAEESAEGDMIYGELKQDAKEEGAEPFSTKTALPTKQIAADELPKFIGLKKGDIVTFDIQNAFPDEKSRALATGLKGEEAAGLEGEFTFTVDDITRNEPAEIGQEFFDKVLGKDAVENEEQFREKVLEIIKSNYGREATTLQRIEIEQALLDNIAISLPDDFLKQWLLSNNEGNVTEADVEEQYEAFARSVKLQLIKNKIASENEVNVSYEDVMETTRSMVREQFGFYGDDEQMKQSIDQIARQYLMDEKGNNYMQMYNRMFDDKVIELIKGKLTLEPKTISVDKFKELVSARQPKA
ncbi:trigger factor [Larkinella arboricola]|uniref:Trigger factor n=1 Tax=Larkinella arboricola TaxID=643671 RepID=A0A327WTG8_LARAB|nr:trigger factor [Larkinella arboricola]RAJ95614.1 trigger factor [Larkinella arboricola]